MTVHQVISCKRFASFWPLHEQRQQVTVDGRSVTVQVLRDGQRAARVVAAANMAFCDQHIGGNSAVCTCQSDARGCSSPRA